MSYRMPLVVRFGDLDPAGIVYYPRYLHFCHIGMEEYFHAVVGIDYPRILAEHQLGLPTVRTEVEHRRPLRYGDPIELEVEVTRVGDSSIDWRYRFWHAGGERPSSEARVVTVCVEMSTFGKQRVPDWLRERLKGSEGEAGDG